MSNFLIYLLLSFVALGCNNSKSPKKPAPTVAPVNPWNTPSGTNPYSSPYNNYCSGDQAKDIATGQCASKCNDGQPRNNGQCSPCPNGVAAGSDGRCPQTTPSEGCLGPLPVQNMGPAIPDSRGFYYHQAQNSSGMNVKSYRCLPTDYTCTQNTNSGQICVEVNSSGSCIQYDTRGNTTPYNTQFGYGGNSNGGQSYQTTDSNGISIQAFTCQSTDTACLQQHNAGFACTFLDANRMCGNYTRIGSGVVRNGGITGYDGGTGYKGGPDFGGYNGSCGAPPAFDSTANIQSCFPIGAVMNQPGFSGGYPNLNIRLGFGQQGFGQQGFGQQGFGQYGNAPDPSLVKGGQVYYPRGYYGGGYSQSGPSQMAQVNPQLSSLYGQIGAMNSDPSYQWQMSGNQYPIMFSTSSAPHCQSYNRWIYQNMVLTHGADPCGYVYNAVSALFCAGKMVIQRIRPSLNPVYVNRTDSEPADPSTVVTNNVPAKSPPPSVPAQNPPSPSPVQTDTSTGPTKGGPPALPPLPPTDTPSPTPGEPAPKSTAQQNSSKCVSRVCKLGGSYILSDLSEPTNGASVEAVVSPQPTPKAADFPPNSAETAILAQVAKDKDGVLKLSFSSPDKGVKITKFNYKPGPTVNLAKSGPILYADVTWTTSTGYTCVGINDTFAAVNWAQPKPLNGKCTK